MSPGTGRPTGGRPLSYTGVRGYGYSNSDRDARSFGSTIVPVDNGDLIHGTWLHAGTIEFNEHTPSPSAVLSLVPSKTYVAQLVVGELRNSRGEIVTNQFVTGTTTPTMPNKPKPVLAQVCFQTAADPG